MRDLADLQNQLRAAFGGSLPADAEPETRPAVEPVEFPIRPQQPPTILNALLDRIGANSPFAYLTGMDEDDADDARGLSSRHPGAQALLDAQDMFGVSALIRTLDGILLVANRSFQQLTGYEDAAPLHLEDLGIRLRQAPSADPYDVELSVPGGFRILAWQDKRLVSPAGGEDLIFSIGRDVTDDRNLAHLREEARIRAEEASAAKSRQMATVVHELRTPLNGILGMSHLLWQTSITLEQKNYIGGIRQAGSALAQLVDDLLDYSTMEAGRFRLNSRAENLRQLLESVVEMLAPRAHEKGIEIGATVSFDVPTLMGFDPARLRQVLFNVIGNAVKFTASGGVLIRASMDGDELMISVTDTGPGMSAEEQQKIFDEFEQAGTAKERSGGTGLGLAISARILKEFSGSLGVVSDKGKGTTFTIRFPASSAEGGKEGNDRMLLLRSSRVLLVAPAGPAATATIETIETLGGRCRHVKTSEEAEWAIGQLARQGLAFTDMVVDHRTAGIVANSQATSDLRRILLVSPEERSSQPWDAYDAWLIRPLREQSLVDVLRGRLGGAAGASERVSEVKLELSVEDGGMGLSVLLAEDDPVSAMMVTALLRKAGCKVRHVTDMDQLQKAASSETSPDLIISDIHMPGGDLADILPVLSLGNGNPDHPIAPVLVLSGETDGRIQAQILAQGARKVLQKPVDPQILLQEVRSAVMASRQARSSS